MLLETAPLAAGFVFSTSWLVELLVFVAIYACLAASLNLITGFAGMFSLGHHGFYAVGAYAAGFVASRFGHVEPGSAQGILVFVGSGLASVAAACAAGLALGLPCLRLRGDYLAIATLAFGEIVRIVIENTPALEGSLGLYVPRLVMDPTGRVVAFRLLFLCVGAGLLAATLFVLRNVLRSAHGRAIVSIREDEVASDLLGVRTVRYKLSAFVLGAGIAGLVGWCYAHYNGSIAPREFDFMVGIRILLIVVLGGLGNLWGSVAAAAVLVGAERLLLAGVFGETAKDWMQVCYALFLIALMLGGRDAFLRGVRGLWRRARGARGAA